MRKVIQASETVFDLCMRRNTNSKKAKAQRNIPEFTSNKQWTKPALEKFRFVEVFFPTWNSTQKHETCWRFMTCLWYHVHIPSDSRQDINMKARYMQK
jgi:hypothetical protein